MRVSVLGLVAKKCGCKRVFAASPSCITLPTASYNLRLNLTDPTSQACSGKTTCCCRSAGRLGFREREAALKRSDLANVDPDTPLEKLAWAREEMQRNFQQPTSARTMCVCTVCSERWDTAEDGTNVPPVDAHVRRQLHLSAVARCSDSYYSCIFII